MTNVQVQINGIAPALTPLEVEKQVTFPIETALAGIPGLELTRSFSRNGFAQVTAVFTDRTDIYFARQQVTERLTDAKANLPPGVEVRMGPISTGLGEIYWWAVEYLPADPKTIRDGSPGWQTDGSYLTPEGQRLAEVFERTVYLRTVQDWIIRPQLRTVPGVAGADAIGGFVKQYVVHPDTTRLSAYGLSFGQIVRAIEANNVSRGANYIERNGEGIVVRASGRVETAAEIENIVVATRAGVPIRIKDVADVALGRELRTGSASVNGQEVVLGTALMLVGGNSRTVAAAANAKIAEIEYVFNWPGMSTPLLRAVEGRDYPMVVGIVLTISVLFLLLNNLRAALSHGLARPADLLLTITGMVQGKISANLMSLGALDFGIIVDGAVVIVRERLRRLASVSTLSRQRTLDERLDTIVASTKEMIEPTVFGQAIIIIVYLPLLTFSGVEGKTFEPMAATVIIALVAAFVLSLTLMPAMIAIAITGRVQESETALIRWLKPGYGRGLHATLRRPGGVVAVAILLVALAGGLFATLGQEFTPTLDEKNIVMEVKRIPSTSLSQSQAMQLDNERLISKFPEVAFVFSRTGTPDLAADPMPPSASDTYIIVKPRRDWPDPSLTKDDLISRIEAEAGKLPGNKIGFSQPIEMRFNELVAGVREDLAVKVFGDEFGPMLRTANQIAAVLRDVDGTSNVKVEQVRGLPFLEVRIDKGEIARRGLNLADVQEVVGTAIGGRTAGLLFENDRRFPIIVRLADDLRSDVGALGRLPVVLPQGGSVPLRDLASFDFAEGPNQVSRENGKRVVAVTAEVRGRDIGSVAGEAQDKIARQIVLPAGSWLKWGGQFETFEQARKRLVVVVPMGFALIFLLLLAALGTARDAVLAFSAVPLALTGGVVALWLRGMPFSISAAGRLHRAVRGGCAERAGDCRLFAQLLRQGMSKRAAILEGALVRLRPVIMTALVASLGFLPMAMATGTGAEIQKPLATVVVGGLISATFLTLFVLPALYALFGREQAAAAPAPAPSAATVFGHADRP